MSRQNRYIAASLCALLMRGALIAFSASAIEGPAPFNPKDLNQPIGIARGMFPGRVVWCRDPRATSWNGTEGAWWDDKNSDQQIVNQMVSKTLWLLTGTNTDAAALDALFRHFNQTNGRGDLGYQTGENIVIKINMAQDNPDKADDSKWGNSKGMPSPHIVYSLVEKLILVAGVPGENITLYDAVRYIGDPIYNKIRTNRNANFQKVRFVVREDLGKYGRIPVRWSSDGQVYFADKSIVDDARCKLPECVTRSTYMINMALLRPHRMYGITLCGKNHFGSVRFPSSSKKWAPAPLHDYGRKTNSMRTYNCLVDLIGHKHLGGKTFLYMIDGLYAAKNQKGNVIKFKSFDDDWSSCVFASQDPIAIDSVALDFLRNEANCPDVTGNVDNYLHEAALANNPPSGSKYAPNGDGVRLQSLGVHEHWNNPTDRLYSRNLGSGNGIELLKVNDSNAW